MPGQPEQALELPDGTFLVGAAGDNHLILPFAGVSQKHCRILVSGSALSVADCGSSNGTYCGSSSIGQEYRNIPAGSVLTIGTVTVDVLTGAPDPVPQTVPNAVQQTPPPQPAPTQQSLSMQPPVSAESQKQEEDEKPSIGMNVNTDEEEARIARSVAAARARLRDPDEVPVLEVSGVPDSSRPIVQQIKKLAHVELLKRLNLKQMAMRSTSENVLEDKAKAVIHEIISDLKVPLPPGVTKQRLELELFYEAVGLGPLETLIAMNSITEIMVNGPDKIYVEYKGVLYRTDMSFADGAQVQAAIERIVSPLGRRIDESSPMVDARLKDGSRVNAIIPPLSLVGPSITIRKFSKKPLQVQDLVRYGSISNEIATFLNVCVKLRKNIVISGGTGSGKTTLLNILSGFLPNRERIVTIEDAAELQLRQEHVVRLESRPANIEGKGEVAIRDLVKNSLRMRPDRIVIGECRGGEALDMLQAMNTGHDGSLTTIHANTPRDCLSRLETLVLMAGFDLPLRAIREQIASAISIIVQINREKDGSRKITAVSEITKMEGDIITMQDLFVYKQEGWTEDGKMIGSHVATGSIPTFMEDIKRAGLPLDISIFTPPKRKGGSFL